MISEIIECKNKSGNRADGAHIIHYIFGKTKDHLLTSTKQNNIEYICANLIDLPDPTFTFYSGTFSKISGENVNVDPFIKEIEKQEALNPAVKTPYKHFIISLPAGEELTNIQWQDVTKTFMKEMGYQHCKYVVTKHNDTDKQHIHIAACTVQNLPRHPVVNQWQEKVKATTLMRTFETKYGLQTVADPFDGNDINNKERFSIKNQLRIYIDAAIQQCIQSGKNSLPELIKQLKKMDVHCFIQFQNGKAKGICYRFKDMSIPGGKLGANRRYALPGLIKQGITYIPACDNPALEHTNEKERENRPFAPRELPDVSPTQQSSNSPSLPKMNHGYSYFYLCIPIPKSKVRCLKTKTQRPNYIRSNGINAVLFYLCRTKAERDHLKLVEAMLKIFSAIFERDQDFRDVEPQLVTDLRLNDYTDWKALTRFEDPRVHTLELPSSVQQNTEITSKNQIQEYEVFTY
ncbi:relaxase/mobilization nuclease domain-containing protein [uncultured Tolumonas sp.]|uniref:relaxase/mobilization nuclease domain-containing protein n=1 Tax=uncultured Tolumonas sp. TaxID=263765 RepID=UPI0029304838|nr:relaxase/mobilization nuclease domain-containing protein [uncultured Tolumonas sp.]